MRTAGIRNARRIARRLVHELGLTAPHHIRIEAIAKRLGASVEEVRLQGAQAQLVRTAHGCVINVSDTITDIGARRFSIAHELGHFVLDHPTMAPHLLSHSRSRPANENERDYEAEANAFASELLLPYVQVKDSCRARPCLHLARNLSNMYSVSILTAARRVAEMSPHPCAAVFSQGRRVVWWEPSASFGHAIDIGRAIDPASIAFQFFSTGALDERPTRVSGRAWIDNGDEIVEHATASVEHGTVLSLLWLPRERELAITVAANI